MLYQRKTLPDTLIGDPAPLPAELVGLSDASLADLSAAVPEAAQELGYAGQAVNPLIADYQHMLDAATVVRLSDPDIQTGVPLLELGGLIGVGRAAQILAGEAP